MCKISWLQSKLDIFKYMNLQTKQETLLMYFLCSTPQDEAETPGISAVL